MKQARPVTEPMLNTARIQLASALEYPSTDFTFRHFNDGRAQLLANEMGKPIALSKAMPIDQLLVWLQAFTYGVQFGMGKCWIKSADNERLLNNIPKDIT